MFPEIAQDIEIVVLAHGCRPVVTAQTLGDLGMPYRFFENPDWEWPEDHPELREDRSARPIVRGYALRQYRAFKGHQEILRTADPNKFTMVFEDDMSLGPDTTPLEVVRQINGARRFISEGGYDAVSFHARQQTPPRSSVTLFEREYVELSLQPQEGWGHQFFLRPVAKGYNGKYKNYLFRWHEGCLAFLAGPKAREKWLAAGHGHGMPCDLFLANELHTIVMRNTIFKHDSRHGSLIAFPERG